MFSGTFCYKKKKNLSMLVVHKTRRHVWNNVENEMKKGH